MTELADLKARVTRLEERMDDVQNLAKGTDREVSSWRSVLRNHTEVLNGMSDRLDAFKREVDDGFARVDARFAQVDARFDRLEGRFDTLEGRFDTLEGRVNDGFTKLSLGQAQITALLNIAIGRSGEAEGSAGLSP